MSVPKYQQIYKQLAQRIADGAYVSGDRVPSEKELAQAYGVSRITSKRALEILSKEQYIQRIPGKGSFVCGTLPEKPAAAPVPRRIGVVLDGLGSFSRVLVTLEARAEKSGCFLVPRVTYGRSDCEENAIEALTGLGVDGIVLMAAHGEQIMPSVMKLVLGHTPFVMVDRLLKGIPAPFVGTDNFHSAARATDYLLELGHRSISFLTRRYKNTLNLENRVDGFVKSHAAHGVSINEETWVTDIESVEPDGQTPEHIGRDIEKIQSVLRAHREVTCFFAAEYVIAELAEKAAADMGLRIPEDISILCFDAPANFIGESFFTGVVQREVQIADTAMDLMLGQLAEGPLDTAQPVYFDADLVSGRSTAPVRLRQP